MPPESGSKTGWDEVSHDPIGSGDGKWHMRFIGRTSLTQFLGNERLDARNLSGNLKSALGRNTTVLAKTAPRPV